MKLPKIATVRKAIVPVLGGVAELVSLGFVHGTALTIATCVISVATALGVYRVPNAKTPVTPPAA
ncbi:MAG TPA: hypothetical protein VGH54_10240 [Mycobacterium sp.]|jgi:hypothetical protein|uniref:hypothetical protein n=1 Tax=Mycobacterium sp. TaxID=1785 RepID=UPI002F42E56B